MNEMEVLKPCPFCGSTKIDSIFIRDGRAIACACGAAVRAYQPNAEECARTAWNRRPADALSQARAERNAAMVVVEAARMALIDAKRRIAAWATLASNPRKTKHLLTADLDCLDIAIEAAAIRALGAA